MLLIPWRVLWWSHGPRSVNARQPWGSRAVSLGSLAHRGCALRRGKGSAMGSRVSCYQGEDHSGKVPVSCILSFSFHMPSWHISEDLAQKVPGLEPPEFWAKKTPLHSSFDWQSYASIWCVYTTWTPTTLSNLPLLPQSPFFPGLPSSFFFPPPPFFFVLAPWV